MQMLSAILFSFSAFRTNTCCNWTMVVEWSGFVFVYISDIKEAYMSGIDVSVLDS